MNSIFFAPTKIIYGKNSINKHKDKLKLGSKALIVTGKNSSKFNGSLDDVENSLKELKVPYVIFNEVEENPSLETIEKIATLGKKENIDFLIGIGGGSPLDASKAAGILIKNPNLTINALSSNENFLSFPIVAIPTTAGTGSEVTPYSIVTDNNLKTKRSIPQKIFPEIAFLDATYLMNTPKNITRNTAIDALSHLIEGYLSANSNIFSDMLAEKALEDFSNCKKSLLEDNISFEIREKLLICSTIAGIVISQSGTSLPHGMGYALTYFKNIPHGKANGVLLKSYLDFCQDKTKVNKILSLLQFNNTEDLGIFLEKLLGEKITLTKTEILEYSKSMAENKNKLKNHPFKVAEKDIIKIYTESVEIH